MKRRPRLVEPSAWPPQGRGLAREIRFGYRWAVRAYVTVRTPDGQCVELNPEAVIGRMASARLRLNDPSVSEAHALVSLRGTQLKLLSLRGRFTIDGAPMAEATLSRGQIIELGPRVRLEVLEVSVPPHVHAIRAEGLPLRALPPVASITAHGGLEPGFSGDAAAILWLDGEVVWLRRPQCEDERLHVGEAFDAAGQTFVLERMQVGEAESVWGALGDIFRGR